MPTGTKLVSNVPIIQTFLEHFEKEKPILYETIIPLVVGMTTLDVIRKIAEYVGFPGVIDAEKPIVDALNAIWPYIINFPGDI